MNRRSTLLVLLLFLLSVTVPLVPAGPVILSSEPETTVIPLLTEDTPSSTKASPALPAGPTQVAGQYEYDGLGATRTTQEYALGTNTSLTVTNLNYSASNTAGGMRLPAGWTGYRMQANISNLYDQLYWITGSRENGDFETGGATATSWTQAHSGTIGTNGTAPLYGWGWNYGYHGYGGNDTGYSGTRGVQAWIEFDSGYSWNTGKWVAWEKNVTIPRDSPTYGRLTFRYQVDFVEGSSASARGRMVVYVYVAGRTYPQMIAENEKWQQVTVSIPDDHLATWPQHGSILVRLGFSFTSTQSAWDWEGWAFNFDDVTLEVRGKAQPQHTWLQLQMNSTTVANGASYGLGNVAKPGTWANPGTSPRRVVANWTTGSSSSRMVSFTYNLTLYIKRTSTTGQQTPPHGTSFRARNQSDVYWSFWFYAYQPYFFQRYNLTIQRPTAETWALAKVTDPLFVDRTSLVQTNSTHFLLPYTSIQDYGWWNFNVTSTNRVSSLTLNSRTFQLQPNTPNTLTVTATLSVSTGEANLTLYSPAGSVVKEERKTVTGTSVAFNSIVFNANNGTWFPPGIYTLCVSYDNGATGSMTAAGFKSALITVKHGSTTLTPEQDPYTVTRAAGSYFYPRLQFWDNDTPIDALLTGATVVTNWTGSNSFYPSGSWYEVKLAADAKVAGNYTLRVNATLSNYGDAYRNIKIVVFEGTVLSSPDSPGMTQPYNKQVAVRFRFVKVYDSTAITGATVTSNWTGATTPTSNGTGWYNFTIDTAQVAKPGTYYMMVTAKKTNHQQQTLTLTIVVRERNTNLLVAPPATVPFGNNSVFTANITDLDNGGAPIPHDANRVHFTIRNSTHIWGPGGLGYASITYTGTPGKYQVTIVTSSLSGASTYNLQVIFEWYHASSDEKPFYGNRTTTVYMTVRERSVALSSTSPTTVPVNELSRFNVTLWDLDNNPDSAITNNSKLHLSVWYGGQNWYALGKATITQIGALNNFRITVNTSTLGGEPSYAFEVRFSWYGGANNQPYYGAQVVTVYVGVRRIATSISYTPPDQIPWGNNLVLSIRYFVDDSASSENGQGITGVATIGCTLDSTPLELVTEYTWSPGVGGYYTITILASKISSVKSYSLVVSVTALATKYNDASRTIGFTVRRHHTQVVVDPPAQTPYLTNTPVTFHWYDLDLGGALIAIGNIYQVTVTGYGAPQVFTNPVSWTLTLTTNTWPAATYSLTLAVTCDVPPDLYDSGSSPLTVRVRIHYTGLVVQPPDQTPWGRNTTLVIQWTDLDLGGTVAATEASRIDVVTPFGNQTFNNPTTLTITLDTDGWSMNTYTLTVYIYAKTSPLKYSNANGGVQVTIRYHRVYVIPLGPAPVPQQGNIPFSITWTDLETSSPINPSNLLDVVVTRISGPATPTLPATYFALSFNHNATGWVPGDYSLNVTLRANSALYQTGWGSVTVTIRVHVVTSDIDPIARVPYGNNFTFTLRVNDTDLVPSQGLPENHITSIRIRGGPTTITYTWLNWTGNVQNGTKNDGIWVVRIDSRTWGVGSYSLTVDVFTSTTYADGVVYTEAQVRSLATSFTYQSPPVVAWGEYGRLTVTFIVSDPTTTQDGAPITGSTITIAGYSSPTHFTYVGYANGTYVITFSNSTVLTAVGPYYFDVTITRGVQYASGFLNDVPLTVRALFTWLHPVSVPTTPYGDIVVILVAYQVLDAGSYRNLYNISTTDIRVNASTLVKNTHYTVTWLPALKLYNITLFASVVSQIRWYNVRIDALNGWPSPYQNDTIARLDFQVRTVATSLALTPPDSQPWGDNFTIMVTYIINDPDSRRNGLGLAGYAKNITLSGYSRPSQYTVQDLLLGNYRIVLNASLGKAPGVYTVTLNIVWTLTPPPYTAQTKQFGITITQRPTDTPNSPGVEFGYADFIIANFTYIDLARGSARILNTSYGGSNILVKVYWKHPVHTGGSFWLLGDQWWNITVMISQPHAFKLTIKADFWGYVDTYYDFNVSITWKAGTAPYFSADSFGFRAYVVGQRTNLTLEPTQGATAYMKIMNFTVVYMTMQGNPITNQTPNNHVHFRLVCAKVPGLAYGTGRWTVEYMGAGRYTIHVWTTALGAIDTYLFYLNVTYDDLPNPTPPPYYQSQYNMPVVQEVRAIDTLLNYATILTVYYGENVKLVVEYRDQDFGIHVPGTPTIRAYWSNGTQIVGAVVFQESSGPHQYWWNITIPTAGVFNAGQYVSFEIRANKTYYVSQKQSLQVYINLLPLDIQLKSDAVIEKFYGETPYPLVSVTLKDLYGTFVTDATVTAFADWGSFPLTSVGNGTYWDLIETEHDRDRYPIEIRASRVGQYANDSVYITLTITAGPSVLATYPLGIPTSFLVYSGEAFNITIRYATGLIPGSGVPLNVSGGASVTFSCPDLKIGSGTFIMIAPGVYWYNFSSIGLDPVVYTIAVKASYGGNVQAQSLSFSIDVRFTPVQLWPESSIVTAEYLENFTIRVRAVNVRNPMNPISLPGIFINATWEGLPLPVVLRNLGDGWYEYTLDASRDAGYTYPIALDITTTGLAWTRTIITLVITRRATADVTIGDAQARLGEWNRSLGVVLEIPVGDWLYVYLKYLDNKTMGYIANGTGVAFIDGIQYLGNVTVTYDIDRHWYLVKLYINQSVIALGTHSLSVNLGKTNYLPQVFPASFTVIRIPTELQIERVAGYAAQTGTTYTVYIGNRFDVYIKYRDTWHDLGVENAILDLPTWWTAPGDPAWEDLGNGSYVVHGQRSALGEVLLELSIAAGKTEPLQYSSARIGAGVRIDFRYSPTFILLTIGGSAAAVALVISLLGWLLWARVFSIPWEVRRMRGLAKKVDREQGYELSRKDRKRFRDRPVAVEDTVGKAMSPVGVAVTAAMLPTTKELVEVSATEEDIMGELDKIPGLGAEEKAVLAQEMRKIPRKDRVWFLDDLRRQMGERRMDFLTTKTPTPAPAPMVHAGAAAKPGVAEAPKPVAPAAKPVKPKEKVEKPEKAEKAEKPKERVAPTVRPKEEHVAPPPTDAVEAEIRRELDKIPGLTKDEKAALLEHLKYLTPEERRATYQSLRQTADE